LSAVVDHARAGDTDLAGGATMRLHQLPNPS
jgi:hypothetical protein